LNNKPLELDVAENLGYGVDVKNAPLPPNDTNGMIAFNLKNFPIEVPGDQTLSVRVKNISGADKSPTSGSAKSLASQLSSTLTWAAFQPAQQLRISGRLIRTT